MITTTLPPVVGGLENQVWELARRLAGAGHQVTLIGSRNYLNRIFPAYEERDGVLIHRLPDTVLPVYYFRYRLFIYRAATLIHRLGGRNSFDLVHAHQIYPAGVAGALARLFDRTPLVITCHGSALPANWKVPWIRPLMRWSLARSSRVIAVGSGIERELLDRDVPPGRLAVIPNPVDTDLFSPSVRGEKIRNRYGWKSEDMVISFAGRLHPVKDPRSFIRMGLRLLKDDPGLKFVLIGSGEQEAELRDEISRSGRARSFVLTGAVEYREIRDYLAAAQILVVPSRFEGSGLIAREGMAMGLPVVASRVGGLPDSIDNGRTGILVDRSGGDEIFVSRLAREVWTLNSKPARRRELGERARRSAEEQFSWRVGLARYLQVYASAVG